MLYGVINKQFKLFADTKKTSGMFLRITLNAYFQRARQPINFRSASKLLDHVRDALDESGPCSPPQKVRWVASGSGVRHATVLRGHFET